MLIYTLSSILLVNSIVLLLDLTPERITSDLERIITPKQSLRNMAKIAQGKKKTHKLSKEFASIRETLETIGKGGQFSVVCTVSLCLMLAGAVLSLLIGNVFLVPVLTTFLAVAPFFYIKSSLLYYKKHVENEIETALSIISTAYTRSDNIVSAVSESISYIKPPVSHIFSSFVVETTSINSDIKEALRHLRERVDNQIYREWCDCLLQCQEDRTLKTSLMPIVNKLTDVRIVNNELNTMLSEPKKEYWLMVIMVISNIPLLYLLNKDWFDALMYTLPGKIVLAVCGAVIVVTSMFMAKYTKPLEYRR